MLKNILLSLLLIALLLIATSSIVYQVYLNLYTSDFDIAAASAKIKTLKEKEEEARFIKALKEKEEEEARFTPPEMIGIPGKNYEMGKYDVTQKEWRVIMGRNPSQYSGCGDTCPVEQVSWNDVQAFIQKLNAKTGKQYRLPIEEEWKYACYGGSQTEYCGGNNPDSVAWYKDNSKGTTQPVGGKQANGYGLYDMSGNVWQWVQNEADGGRVLRGGSWYSGPFVLRAAFRLNDYPSDRGISIGFRLARTLP